MDPDLRQALDTLEQRMATHTASAIASAIEASETRMISAIKASEGRMFEHVAGVVRASEDRMFEHVAGVVRASEDRMFEHVAGVVRASEDRTVRHMTILIEGLRSDSRIATEAIVPLNRRVEALEEQGGQEKQRVDRLEGRVGALEHDAKARRRRPK